ncbi:MAG: glutamine--fructose-6-phosphate transaminase (isomerizing), partial [Fretibacterium sp.]|nr:glutamine--fructose-6-phosphate transaminase (isomerizing) [Fretibacterium sp.]
MCGILGYTGNRQAAPILLDGLAKLEYRGYDSAGLAVVDGEEVRIEKAKGRLSVLSGRIDGGKTLAGTSGIGHTRWATHGEPSDTNAHPLWSDDKAVIAIHNGIIENYRELKEELTGKGYSFYSQTDTETAVKLIDLYYKEDNGDPLSALTRAMRRIRGSYCFVILFRDHPDEVWGVRKDNPLIAGQGKGEAFLTSDVSAILQDTRQVYYLDNMQIARLRKGEISLFDQDGNPITKELSEVTWDAQAAEKGGFDHFMMKEIHEQAKAVRDTIHSVLREDGNISLSSVKLSDEELREVEQIYIIACGSAYHAGVVGQYVIEDLAKVPVRMELASEFRYRTLPLKGKGGLAIVISQSGETADTLAAMRLAKEHGLRTLAIVNVVGSSIAREADNVFYTLAGPEIAVATTKAYSAQLAACYLLAVQLAKVRGLLADESALMAELQTIPKKIDDILDEKERIRQVAEQFVKANDAFFLGRNIDYAVAMEGSLKMKEISYLHSEACAAGEMKHGPISLVEKGMLVVGILTQEALYKKTASNMLEVKSRGAWLMQVTHRGNDLLKEDADFTFYIPQTDGHFAASLAVIPLQLLGYYLAVARGVDVDKPRNLAKSVT